MPKRSIVALGLLLLALTACKSASTSPTPTTSPSPTVNPDITTATVDATYNNAAYTGTIYANAAPSGCPASTEITGSTVSATPTVTTVNNVQVGQAVFSSATGNALVANTYYVFFFVPPTGPVVSSLCTESWTYGTITLSYP